MLQVRPVRNDSDPQPSGAEGRNGKGIAPRVPRRALAVRDVRNERRTGLEEAAPRQRFLRNLPLAANRLVSKRAVCY